MLSSNLAVVNNFFRLEGWHLLLMRLIFFSAFFICGLAFSRGTVSLMTLNMSGFLLCLCLSVVLDLLLVFR